MSQIFKLSFPISFAFFWANIGLGEGKSIYIYCLSWFYVSDFQACKNSIAEQSTFSN